MVVAAPCGASGMPVYPAVCWHEQRFVAGDVPHYWGRAFACGFTFRDIAQSSIAFPAIVVPNMWPAIDRFRAKLCSAAASPGDGDSSAATTMTDKKQCDDPAASTDFAPGQEARALRSAHRPAQAHARPWQPLCGGTRDAATSWEEESRGTLREAGFEIWEMI